MVPANVTFRVIFSAIWTIFIAPFLVLVWRGVLDRGDVANHPKDWLMGRLDWIVQIPGFYPSALIATGILVGVWVDWLLKRFDGSREYRRETLCTRVCYLSHSIPEPIGRYYSDWYGW